MRIQEPAADLDEGLHAPGEDVEEQVGPGLDHGDGLRAGAQVGGDDGEVAFQHLLAAEAVPQTQSEELCVG